MANHNTKKAVAVAMEEIVNRVAKSPIVSIDLEDYLSKGSLEIFDLKNLLFQGLILKERDFRTFLQNEDWSAYRDKNVGLICSADAIVPTWAYMLLTSKLGAHANLVTYGGEEAVERAMIDQAIVKCLQEVELNDKKVVIKGCGNVQNVAYAYTAFTAKVLDKVSSLMYGEPCSTVPIFKQKNQAK